MQEVTEQAFSPSDPPATALRGRTVAAWKIREGKILDAIVDLLMEGGYGAVTTDAVASRADVSKATIYRRWRNKSDLIIAALARVLPPVIVPDLGNFGLEMRWLLESRTRDLARPGIRNMMAGIIGASVEDPKLDESLRARIVGSMAAHRSVFERAIARGELAPGNSVDDLATALAGPFVYRVVWERQAPNPELLELIVQSMLALAAQKPAG